MRNEDLKRAAFFVLRSHVDTQTGELTFSKLEVLELLGIKPLAGKPKNAN